jgi:hypothetical protein
MNMQLSRWQSWMRSLAMDIPNSFEMSKVNVAPIETERYRARARPRPAPIRKWLTDLVLIQTAACIQGGISHRYVSKPQIYGNNCGCIAKWVQSNRSGWDCVRYSYIG